MILSWFVLKRWSVRCISAILFALLGVTIFADVCPQCSGKILSTDTYCPKCGHALADWRLQTSKPKPIELAPTDSEPVGLPIRQTETGSVTPFELSLIGPVGIPGGFFDSVTGLQLSLIYGDSNIMRGIQLGLGNQATIGECVQIGGVNVSGSLRGIEIGIFNFSDKLHGVQCGIVNWAATASAGSQFGLLNFIMDNQVPMLPIFNCYY